MERRLKQDVIKEVITSHTFDLTLLIRVRSMMVVFCCLARTMIFKLFNSGNMSKSHRFKLHKMYSINSNLKVTLLIIYAFQWPMRKHRRRSILICWFNDAGIEHLIPRWFSIARWAEAGPPLEWSLQLYSTLDKALTSLQSSPTRSRKGPLKLMGETGLDKDSMRWWGV